MTREEVIICKTYLEDLDKHHTCNEYKLLMQLLEQEPCTVAISRQAVLMEIDKYLCGVPFEEKGIDEVIKELPPVTSAKKVGRWINARVGKIFPSNDYKCSECGNILNFDGVNCGRGDANYCPNCGAKMQEGKE